MFGSGPSQYTPTPPPNMANKGKGITQSTNDDALKKIIPFMEEEGLAPNRSILKHFRTTDEGPIVTPSNGAWTEYMLLYNGNFDMIFHRRSEYNLASTPQLIRIQNLIKIDSLFAQEIYDELIWVIETKADIVEARNIVKKNLDGLGND
ncbi:hypothetical protein Tco_1582067 [Tanacetum coccineum]